MKSPEQKNKALSDARANPHITLEDIAHRNGIRANTLKFWMRDAGVQRGHTGMSIGGKITRKRKLLSRLMKQVSVAIAGLEALERQQKAQ